MIRPRLRPTLSRKVKYWGIAPTAEKKLGREARRGSHDLRRLVGHANFLDVLVGELNSSDDEDEIAPVVQARTSVVRDEPAKGSADGEHDNVDDEDTASDSWSEYDSSDDDEYALVRTVSGRPHMGEGEMNAEGRKNSELATGNVENYFQLDHSNHAVITVDNALNGGEADQYGEEDYKKDAIVSVTIASATLTPLASPTDEIEPSHTS